MLFDELNVPHVTLKPFALKVPAVSVKLLVVTKASAKVTVPLVVLTIIADPKLLPFDVMMPADEATVHCNVAVTEFVIAADIVRSLAKAIEVDVDDHVPEKPAKLTDGIPMFVPENDTVSVPAVMLNVHVVALMVPAPVPPNWKPRVPVPPL